MLEEEVGSARGIAARARVEQRVVRDSSGTSGIPATISIKTADCCSLTEAHHCLHHQDRFVPR